MWFYEIFRGIKKYGFTVIYIYKDILLFKSQIYEKS